MSSTARWRNRARWSRRSKNSAGPARRGRHRARRAHRLLQVLTSLLNNATKNTQQGGRNVLTTALRGSEMEIASPPATSAWTRCCCRTCSSCSFRPNAARKASRSACRRSRASLRGTMGASMPTVQGAASQSHDKVIARGAGFDYSWNGRCRWRSCAGCWLRRRRTYLASKGVALALRQGVVIGSAANAVLRQRGQHRSRPRFARGIVFFEMPEAEAQNRTRALE